MATGRASDVNNSTSSSSIVEESFRKSDCISTIHIQCVRLCMFPAKLSMQFVTFATCSMINQYNCTKCMAMGLAVLLVLNQINSINR